MKFLGMLSILVAVVGAEHSGQIGWGTIFLVVMGAVMLCPNLLQYLFEGQSNERK